MPSRSFTLVLSPRARQDFVDILRYTGDTWGEMQLHAYRDKIDLALKRLQRNPDMGHGSVHLPQTHKLYLVGSHVIIYRVQSARVLVARILHQRMQPGEHL